jgi:hypothetical protein
MAYEFTVDATDHSGQLYVTVSPPGLAAWFETETSSDPPPNSGAPVVANWWFNGPFATAKLSTSIGSTSHGPAATTVYASKLSLLGTLFGGNVDNNFPFLKRAGSVRRRGAIRHLELGGSRMQIENAIETQASVTARIPWEVRCLMAAATSVVLGLYWDLAWHRSIGRDSFWTPAHLAIYLGGVLGGIAAAGSVLPATLGRSARALSLRAVSARVWGFRGPLGAFVSAWGGIAMLTSATFDNWWHNAYGLDVKVVSPPHILLLLGIVAVESGGLLLVQQLRTNASESRHARFKWLILYVGGMILSTIMIALEEFASRFTLHSALAYAVLSGGVPLILLTIGGASGHRWGCTAVAGVYMLARLLQLWVFPLFPAEPKLGPVFIHVT